MSKVIVHAVKRTNNDFMWNPFKKTLEEQFVFIFIIYIIFALSNDSNDYYY